MEKINKVVRRWERECKKQTTAWPLLKDQCYSTYSCGKECISLTAVSVFGKILVVILKNGYENPMSCFLIIQILVYFC